MKKRSTNESLFVLVFGIEAMLLMEASLPTITGLVEENQSQLTRNLDLLEEVQECTQISRAGYEHKARTLYDQKVKVRCFIRGE